MRDDLKVLYKAIRHSCYITFYCYGKRLTTDHVIEEIVAEFKENISDFLRTRESNAMAWATV